MRVGLVVGAPRPETHLTIVRATFQEAGWDIEVQLGWSIDLLGLALTTSDGGAEYIPERRGLIEDIRGVLGACGGGGGFGPP